MTEDATDTGALAGALEALAARGARRADPVRWHLAEALLRRVPAHEGEARRLIEQRLASLVEALDAAIDGAEAGAGHAAPLAGASSPASARPSPLAALLTHAKAHAKAKAGPADDAQEPVDPMPATSVPARSVKPAPRRPNSAGRVTRRVEAAPVPAPPPAEQPPALDYFRRTWSRLKADERLAQSRASLPANAGPLNSHHLVHRALATLHELAPGYYEHFIGHVDDLLWIEAATGAAGPEAAAPVRAEGERKGRGR